MVPLLKTTKPPLPSDHCDEDHNNVDFTIDNDDNAVDDDDDDASLLVTDLNW